MDHLWLTWPDRYFGPSRLNDCLTAQSRDRPHTALFQRLYDAPDAVSNAGWSLACSLPLNRDPSSDLTTPRAEISQCLSPGLGAGANGRIGSRREPGDHKGVNAIGLGRLAQSLSQYTDAEVPASAA